MLPKISRGLTRRRFLGGSVAVFGAASLLPRRSQAGPAPTSITALAFDGDALIAAGRDRLWRWWSGSSGPVRLPRPVTQLASHPARPDRLYASQEGGGLSRSDDGGRSWTATDTGLPDRQITAVTLAALEPDMLYAAVQGDGLWRSKDAGESWDFVMDRPYLDGAEHDVLSLVSVGNATGMGGIWLYGGTGAGLTRVPDCFCRWQDVTAGDAMDALAAGRTPPPAAPLPDEPITQLALAPDRPERLYAGLQSGLWASTDAGVNWARAATGAITALAVAPADPQHIAAIRDGALSVSRDGGATWTLLPISKDS